MPQYDPGRYGEAVGDYDDLYPGVVSDTAAAVDLLAELAATCSARDVLEFGIGTGRLALPLCRRGHQVTGIDGSERMIAQLRAKPDGELPRVVIGDYRDTVVGVGGFSTVALPLNGIFDPRGLNAQLDIFRNAARHLVPGGHFVVESWVMSDRERNGAWSVLPRYVGEQHVEFQLARYEIATNRIQRTLLHLRPEGTQFVTVTDTYAAPGELDVMATATGFERVARYSRWDKTEFTSTSSSSISVFRRLGA